MSSATLAPPDPATGTPPPKARPAADPDEPLYGGLDGLWRFSVADYQAMIKAGVLGPWTPVELLHGLVVRKMPQGADHVRATRILTRWFCRALGDEWTVGSQHTTEVSNSQPEPDVGIARGSEATFAGRYVRESDLALVVEVSDSSLRRDRREKLAIYAAAGVPEYWIVNVPQRQVEVYSKPNADFYDGQVVYAPGQDVPVSLDGVAVGAIPVAELFARPEAA